MGKNCTQKTSVSLGDLCLEIPCARMEGHLGAHEGKLDASGRQLDVSWPQENVYKQIKLIGYVEEDGGRQVFKGFAVAVPANG